MEDSKVALVSMLVLEFAQNIRKWASGFRFDMAGLPSIGSMVAAGRMQPR